MRVMIPSTNKPNMKFENQNKEHYIHSFNELIVYEINQYVNIKYLSQVYRKILGEFNC